MVWLKEGEGARDRVAANVPEARGLDICSLPGEASGKALSRRVMDLTDL